MNALRITVDCVTLPFANKLLLLYFLVLTPIFLSIPQGRSSWIVGDQVSLESAAFDNLAFVVCFFPKLILEVALVEDLAFH
ncbi:hypothetical protein V6N13_140763 [Hibiscus sabdariffa]|uniref:Uncharacterized protein n=1 Tax=Hibiscus sabdariffa TaxID=183260 RepID=A0ABR2Q1Y1_9ROSI